MIITGEIGNDRQLNVDCGIYMWNYYRNRDIILLFLEKDKENIWRVDIMIVIDIETDGLNAMKDRITCISCLSVMGDVINTFCGEDEKKILEEFWSRYIDNLKIITFNGDGFDIPFIIKRSLINNIKMKKIGTLVDLRKIVNGFFYSYNKYEKGTLNDWSNVLGFGDKDSNGEEMIKAFERNDYEFIKEHCEEDVKLTKALYKRCVECNLI